MIAGEQIPERLSQREFFKKLLHDLATKLSAVSLQVETAERRLRRGGDPQESLAGAQAALAKAIELLERGRQTLLADQ